MLLHFIAINVPAAINGRVLGLKQYMLDRYGCSVALRSPAHITLIAPFYLPDALLDHLQTTLLHFAAGVADFTIELKNFSCFPPRVIYIDVVSSISLQRVQAGLEEHLLPTFPIKKSTRPFHPHVTIANRDLDQACFAEAWNHFKTERFEERFSAPGISLMQYKGSRWETIYTAAFGTGQDNFAGPGL